MRGRDSCQWEGRLLWQKRDAASDSGHPRDDYFPKGTLAQKVLPGSWGGGGGTLREGVARMGEWGGWGEGEGGWGRGGGKAEETYIGGRGGDSAIWTTVVPHNRLLQCEIGR